MLAKVAWDKYVDLSMREDLGNMPLSLQVRWVDRAAAIHSAADNLN